MKIMKTAAKTAACLAAVCMALGAFPAGRIADTAYLGINAGAEAVLYSGVSANVSWTLDESGTLTLSGYGAMENYDSRTTPFYNTPYKSLIKKIVIESGVTSIGSYAFYGLQSVTNVSIPATVTTVGDDAFAFCTALKSLYIPNSVKSIGSASLSGTGLTILSLPADIEMIGKYAVTGCDDLESVVIPSGILSLGAKAFAYNESLSDVFFKGTRAEWYGFFAMYGKRSDTEIKDYLGLDADAEIHFIGSQSDDDPYSGAALTMGGVSASATEISPSGTFTVYFDIPALRHNADTVSFRATFDPSVFEVVSWYSNDPTDSRYVGNVISGGMANNGNGFLSISATNAAHSIDLSKSIRLSAEMRVKSSAQAGSYNITITKHSISYVTDGGRESIELWDPDSKNVQINVSSNPIRGRVTGYGDNKGKVTVQLIDSYGNVVDSVTSADGTYAFNKAASGQTYRVRASMPRCAPREYTVTASSTPVVNDMVIYRYGDVNGDTFVDSKDATQILRYDAGLPSVIKDVNGRVDEYILFVAKVLGNSTLTPKDATQIMRYEAGYTSVFDTMT